MDRAEQAPEGGPPFDVSPFVETVAGEEAPVTSAARSNSGPRAGEALPAAVSLQQTGATHYPRDKEKRPESAKTRAASGCGAVGSTIGFRGAGPRHPGACSRWSRALMRATLTLSYDVAPG
jgi:hypothetical protein